MFIKRPKFTRKEKIFYFIFDEIYFCSFSAMSTLRKFFSIKVSGTIWPTNFSRPPSKPIWTSARVSSLSPSKVLMKSISTGFDYSSPINCATKFIFECAMLEINSNNLKLTQLKKIYINFFHSFWTNDQFFFLLFQPLEATFVPRPFRSRCCPTCLTWSRWASARSSSDSSSRTSTSGRKSSSFRRSKTISSEYAMVSSPIDWGVYSDFIRQHYNEVSDHDANVHNLKVQTWTRTFSMEKFL